MKNPKINLLLSMLILGLSTCILIYILSHDVEEIKMASSAIKKSIITIALFGLISVVMFFLIKLEIDKTAKNKSSSIPKNKLYFSDNPITDDSQDRLGRTQFANQLANSVTNWSDEKSLTIALEGKWGEGKTSIIELMKKKLHSEVDVIEFSAWKYSSLNNSSVDFCKIIAKELRSKANLVEISNLFIKFAELFISMSEPFIQESNLIKITKYFFSSIHQFNKITQDNIVDRLESKLKERKYPLLVIIDDLDRVSYSELLIIFNTIKNNLDLPNIVFLLAYSEENVNNLIKNHGDYDECFLKKIINVNLKIPNTNSQYNLDFAISIIKPLFHNYYFGTTYHEHISRDYHIELMIENIILPNLSNIRDIKRFYNIINFKLVGLKGLNINLYDFIALEMLNHINSEIYDSIVLSLYDFWKKNKNSQFSLNDLVINVNDLTDKNIKKLVNFLVPNPQKNNSKNNFRNQLVGLKNFWDYDQSVNYFSFELINHYEERDYFRSEYMNGNIMNCYNNYYESRDFEKLNRLIRYLDSVKNANIPLSSFNISKFNPVLKLINLNKTTYSNIKAFGSINYEEYALDFFSDYLFKYLNINFGKTEILKDIEKLISLISKNTLMLPLILAYRLKKLGCKYDEKIDKIIMEFIFKNISNLIHNDLNILPIIKYIKKLHYTYSTPRQAIKNQIVKNNIKNLDEAILGVIQNDAQALTKIKNMFNSDFNQVSSNETDQYELLINANQHLFSLSKTTELIRNYNK